MNPPSIAGLILAGGASRRMGSPKALLRFQNETFLDRMIRLFSSFCSPVIVVVGYNIDQIRSGIERAGQVILVTNPDPERGMLSSLQCGLAEVPPTADAVIFAPVDHPHLQEATIRMLAEQYAAHGSAVAVPTYAGEHGHPVCISRALVADLCALPATAMASDVIHRYISQTTYFEVPDPAVVTDVDDPQAYAELLAQPQ